MRFGIYISNFGDYHDARVLAQLAQDAERAGWDGFFLWDHIQWTLPTSKPTIDPWIALTAIACATQHIRIGALVTPIPRRRPWKLARETVALDRLSQGRLVIGAGIGGDWCQEYSAFGESADSRLHGAMLDEGLDVLAGLWTGKPFTYTGVHYQLTNVQFLPTPLQSPRIPIWLAAGWPRRRPFVRAAQWDGVFPLGREGTLTPNDFHAICDVMKAQRGTLEGFDIVCEGRTDGLEKHVDAAQITPYREAGVTWWLEHATEGRDAIGDMHARIQRGPPSLT